MPALLRLLANPKLFARFMKTKAGRRAAMKYGTMLVNSKAVQDSAKKLFSQNNDKKRFVAEQKKFDELQARIDTLTRSVDTQRMTDAELQAATFTLGRQVVEMRRLSAQLQQQIQQLQQQMALTQRTR